MADRIVSAIAFLFIGALSIIALPFLILFSPIYLVRRWRRRKGEDAEGDDIFRPIQMPIPAPLARVSAWFKTEEGRGLVIIIGLAVVLIGSLIAVFGMGVEPIGVLVVAVLITLGVMGVLKRMGGVPRGG